MDKKWEHLIEGGIYVVSDYGNIFMKCGNDASHHTTNNRDGYDTEGGNFNGSIINTFRDATEEEKRWLLACKEKGQFIPLEKVEINQLYSIFN